MNAMIARLHANFLPWWQQREPRERAMLALMCAAIAAFVSWYGMFVPLRHARDAAQARHVRAAAELVQVRAELAGLAELRNKLPPPPDAAMLRQTVLAGASHAGLPISRERDDGAGGLEVECDSATSQQLFAWLDGLRQQHGLAPSALSVAKRADRLRVQATFRASR